jgi:2-methylcitrate dehydratase
LGTQAQPVIDSLVNEISTYVDEFTNPSENAINVAWLALFDALGCAMASTQMPACMRHVGPLVPGMTCETGVSIPGTEFRVDPVSAAFSTGCLIRWSDFSDSWVALETGHPSDNIGAILAGAEYANLGIGIKPLKPITVKEVLVGMIKAYEIQGVLGLNNSLGQHGLDHATFVRVASAAVTTKLLGGQYSEIASAVSHAWCDGHPLRIYRQSPNVGPRKSWAGPDAAARGLELAFLALRGEPACGSVIEDPAWGLEKRVLDGKKLSLLRPLGTYVMENVVFKAAYPGVIHAQTALEAAIELHPLVYQKLSQIKRINIWSYGTAIRIASKSGPLNNAADRDHCLQYMVALGLITGTLAEGDFSDTAAQDDRIDELRSKMVVHEDPEFTKDFLNPEIRSCSNGVQVEFLDGTATERIDVEQPLGHASRIDQVKPFLKNKLLQNLSLRFANSTVDTIMKIYSDPNSNQSIPISQFLKNFTFGS